MQNDVGQNEESNLLEKIIANDDLSQLSIDEKKLFLTVMLEEYLRNLKYKKKFKKDFRFQMIKIFWQSLLKDLKGETDYLFFNVLCIPSYLKQVIDNNYRVLRGLNITHDYMTNQNFDVVLHQIIETKKYENDVAEYIDDLSMQVQFKNSFIEYRNQHDSIKERIDSRKQKILMLSKEYSKK